MENKNFELIQKIRTMLNQAFPLGLIPRRDLGKATGGLLNPRTLANLDCLGRGIEEPITVGRQVCYRVERVVEFLEGRISNKITKDAV